MIGGLIMIDTHCHILSEYYDNIDEEIEKKERTRTRKSK